MTRARPVGRLAIALATGAVLLGTGHAQAGVAGQALRQTFTDYCSREARLDARQQDQLLRLADAARQELERSGARAAIVSRAGLDLQRFGQRYSHAGITLREGASLPWAVRQLYYACDEGRPRLFDQGLAGFVMGSDDAHGGFLRLVLLPAGEAADALRRAAGDAAGAAGLVSGRYSANAHAWSTRYQNCNQWLAELIAEAWRPAGWPPVAAAAAPVATAASGAASDAALDAASGAASGTATSAAEVRREAAQQALRQLAYRPERFEVGRLALWAARWVPLLHLDDHPPEDLSARTLHISMPGSIEALVRQRLPEARVVELCRADDRIVVRRDGPPIGERCEAAPGDTVVLLE